MQDSATYTYSRAKLQKMTRSKSSIIDLNDAIKSVFVLKLLDFFINSR